MLLVLRFTITLLLLHALLLLKRVLTLLIGVPFLSHFKFFLKLLKLLFLLAIYFLELLFLLLLLPNDLEFLLVVTSFNLVNLGLVLLFDLRMKFILATASPRLFPSSQVVQHNKRILIERCHFLPPHCLSELLTPLIFHIIIQMFAIAFNIIVSVGLTELNIHLHEVLSYSRGHRICQPLLRVIFQVHTRPQIHHRLAPTIAKRTDQLI